MNYKAVYKDFIVNILAFAFYMIAQQFVLFPNIASYGNTVFAQTILIITAVNVYTYITSSSLGNAMLMCKHKYRNDGVSFDYIFYLIIFCLIVSIGLLSGIALGIFEYQYIYILPITVLCIIRTYYNVVKRMKEQYTLVLLQNILYLIGSCSILMVRDKPETVLLYFLCAELFCCLVYLYDRPCLVKAIHFTNNFHEMSKTFSNFSFQTGVNNLITYCDRFALMPILGMEAVSLFYASTALSKVTMLVVNPISGVLASLLANTEDSAKVKVFDFLRFQTKKYAIPLILINILVSTFALCFFYPQYFQKGTSIVLVMSIVSAITICTNLYNLVCMRFVDSKKLTYVSMVKFFLIVLLGYVCALKYGLIGYTFGLLIANVLTFIIYIRLVRFIV